MAQATNSEVVLDKAQLVSKGIWISDESEVTEFACGKCGYHERADGIKVTWVDKNVSKGKVKLEVLLQPRTASLAANPVDAVRSYEKRKGGFPT